MGGSLNARVVLPIVPVPVETPHDRALTRTQYAP